MADFVAPQFQYPDYLGSYIRGQQSGQQAVAFPGAMQLQQQQIAGGNIDLQQKQLMLQNAKMYQALVQKTLSGTQGTQTGQQPGEPTGGIQNGPQGAVSQPQAPTSGGFSTGIGMDPVTMQAMEMLRPNGDPVKAAIDVRNYQRTQSQMQAQGPLNLFDTVFNSPTPAKVVMKNPSLITQWPQIAQHLGLDPVKDFNDENVRHAIAYGANALRGQVGLPAKDYPNQLQNVDLGQGETGQFDPVTGKKVGDLTERQTPGFTLVDRYDPKSNSTVKVPVQTSGFGMSGTNPATGSPAGASSTQPRGFDVGMKAPTDPELKAAMFGSEMRSGMNTLNRLESTGFELSPKTRALVINTATSEDEGMIKQLVSQEALKHGMSPQEQTYVAALMPMLQAAGHDQSGARLTTSQVRQNVESLLPIDVKNKEALDQVRQNRQGFYNGLLTQAGAAAQLPQYKGTLGADLTAAQRPQDKNPVAPFNDAGKEARYQAWKAAHK